MAAVAILVAASCAKAGPERPRKVAMVIAGSFGDGSFFDGALRGLHRVADELRLDYETVECDELLGRYELEVTGAAERSDIVVVLGYQFFDAIQAVARSFPDVDFIYLDGPIDGIANLSSVDFVEAEGAYLAGVLAALVTADPGMPKANPLKRVGIVGGMDIPVIRDFVDGFLAGVEDVDPETEAYVGFAGSFEDKAAAAKLATAMYAAGADVVFQAAGGAGQGVFDAALEADRYAIGVDLDQRYLDPNRIIASMVKNAGEAVRRLVTLAVEGRLVSGAYRYGLEGGILSLEYGHDDPLVSQEVIERVKRAEAEILSGARRVTGRD